MDIPLIRRFACGYAQGVKAGRPNAEIFQNMTGTTGAAFNDPLKGGELARSQIARGADVIYHAAAIPARACCALLRMRTSSASALIPTRTACIRARC